jgi:hypothetical protein
MKKAIVLVSLAFIAVAFMGCPSVKLPVSTTGSPAGSKSGQASGSIILGMFGDVDASIATAAKAGGITKIDTVDTHIKIFLGSLFITFTTTVTGE